MKPVLEYTNAGSLAVDLLKQLAKSASANTSNPFSISSLYTNLLSAEPSKYFPIRFTAILWEAFGFVKNLAA